MSWWHRIAQHRPILLVMVGLAVLLSGTIAATRLPLVARPSVEWPRLTVVAQWPGASPEVIEMYVTSPLEAALVSVRGVRHVASTSGDEAAILDLTLAPRADLLLTRLQLMERLDLIARTLPAGVSRPALLHAARLAGGDAPLLALALSGPVTPGTLERIARKQVMPQLTRLPGVAGVRVQGGAARGVTVRYDPAQLRAVAIPPQRLAAAIADARRLQPLGLITRGHQSLPLSLRELPSGPGAFESLRITSRAGLPVPLGTLASVHTSEESHGRFLRVNGLTAVVVELLADPTVAVAPTVRGVRRALQAMAPVLPEGVTLRTLRDDSAELRNEKVLLMRCVLLALLLSLGMMALIWRSVMPVVVMSACTLVILAGTALTLYLVRVPVHRLTLVALSLSGSFLLLRAVLLLRARYDRDGHLRRAATAAAWIMGAAMVPVLYLPGESRAMFSPFAITMLIVVGWSVPVLEAGIPAVLRREARACMPRRAPSPMAQRLEAGMMRWRGVLLTVVCVGLIGVYGGWVRSLARSARPVQEDGTSAQPDRLTVQLSLPRGTDPELLDRLVQAYEAMVVGHPAVASVVASTRTPTSARLVVLLHAVRARSSEARALQARLVTRAAQGDGATVQVMAEGPALSTGAGSAFGTRYRLRVKGYEYAAVSAVADDLAARLARVPRLRDLRLTSTPWAEGESSRGVVLVPARQTIAQLGLRMVDVAQQVAREIRGGSAVQYLTIGGVEQPVAVKGMGADQRAVHALASAWWTRPDGALIRVADVMPLQEAQTLPTIVRDGQQYVRYLSYELRGAPHVAERVHRAFLAGIALPPGYSVEDLSLGDPEPDGDGGRGLLLVGLMAMGLILVATSGASDRLWCAVPQAMFLLLVPVGARIAFTMAGVAWAPDAWIGIAYAMGLVAAPSLAALQEAHRGLMACLSNFAGCTAVVLAPPMALVLASPMASLVGRVSLAVVGGVLAAMVGGSGVLPALVSRRAR